VNEGTYVVTGLVLGGALVVAALGIWLAHRSGGH
jgi:hypothetical protein